MSNCIGICKLHNGVCIGCHRTMDEIKAAFKKVLDFEPKV